jgi:iron complex outermembrane receptor protein
MKKILFKQKFLLLLVGCLIPLGVFAQQMRVSGVVTDALSGEELPGVTVVIKGTSTGTITSYTGDYSIDANVGDVLQFSFIGFSTVERTVEFGTALINVALQTSVIGMDEVVVIGYGTVKKSDATGSVDVISASDFNRGSITSPQDLLVGKSAGVVITSSGGAPGSGSTIRVRGGSSLNASNDPLVIVDGVPLDNNNVSGSSNFLSFVNPNDIETFSVLKDASATAIYGSRASNGVIIITTKKGRAGTPLRINYSANTSVSSAIRYTDVYSGDEMRQLAVSKHELYGVSNLDLLGSYNTNWQDEIFRTALTHDHNLSFTGSFDFLPYRISAGYTNQEGILKNTDMERFTASLNLSPTFFNDGLKVSINAKGMLTDHNFGDSGSIGSAINMDPTQPVRDGNAASDGYFQWGNYGAALGTANPVEQALAVDNQSTVKRLIASALFDYTLPFLPELRANLNLSTDYSESEGHNNRPVTSPSVLTSPTWGRLSDYSGINKNSLLDFYLNYVKDVKSIDSRFDLTAGYSWQHFEREGENFTRGHEDSEHPFVLVEDSEFITENYLVSFFGRLNYTLKDRYLLTFTMRNDGSSRFSEKNRWGLFPSAALAWKVNEEAFLAGFSNLTELKVRLGWGITGQQDVANNDYPSQALYREAAEGSYYYINGRYLPTLRPNAYDPDIKWEETETKNIGLDFGFFNNRVSGSVDYYQRETVDLLNTVTIPTGSNFSNRLLTNVGSLENKGVEVALNLIPLSTRDMSLQLGFNFTYNKNEITKLLMTDDPGFIGVLYGDGMTGQNRVTRVGHPAYSFFVNKQIYNSATGMPVEGLYEDLSGEGGTVAGDNQDKYLFKNPAPDYLLGFSLRYSYKNFDVSASSRASIGNYVYNMVAAGSSYDQMYQIGYWKNFPRLLNDTQFVKRQFSSDFFVENASFFKLDNVSVGYNIEKITDRLSAYVSLTAQNIWTITNYKGLDPEVDGGVDNNFYPRPQVYMLGINLSF